MTIKTIRRKLRAIYVAERAQWQRHKKTMRGRCLSSCEDAQRWYAVRDVMSQVLAAVGARLPR